MTSFSKTPSFIINYLDDVTSPNNPIEFKKIDYKDNPIHYDDSFINKRVKEYDMINGIFAAVTQLQLTTYSSITNSEITTLEQDYYYKGE